MRSIVLASSSPQRVRLLLEHGFFFEIFPSDIEENIDPQKTPQENAECLAIQKAKAVFEKYPNSLVLSADTLVVSPSGAILGKPESREHAREMILEKKGKREQVITGFCLLSKEKQRSGAEISEVHYRDFSEDDLIKILNSEEWKEVSGALRIEGKAMKRILKGFSGDRENIIGLPMNRVKEEIQKWDA